MSAQNFKSIEERARAIEQSIDEEQSSDGTLKATIASAELYMQALAKAATESDRTRLRAKSKELLTRAERIRSWSEYGQQQLALRPAVQADTNYPVSRRKLTTREQIILLEGSKLNGYIFREWSRPPSATEFELKDGRPYVDLPPMSLSFEQEQSFAGWQRPREALARIDMKKDGVSLPNAPLMGIPGKMDLVQDMATDCSVVASLCAGVARAERGHPRISGSIVYPYDFEKMTFRESPNGRYVLRFYFNGCWRRVDIDDMLPTSNSTRLLHVVDRTHPGLVWPALMEKAYLKVRGGYDFPGSNSGTDLAVLTGWIPQQVFLHDEDVDPQALWGELYSAFEKGNIMLTIGTGKFSQREQRQMGLAAEHDYAILNMSQQIHTKEMLIKNPWSDGEVWKGATRRRPNPSHEHDEENSLSITTSNSDADAEMIPGTFWMDFDRIFQYFENMYINWNPGLFKTRQDIHFSWQMPETYFVPNVFTTNPQFRLQTSSTGEIWLLLNRHFRTGDYTHANSGKNGYISLYIYDQGGYRVMSTEDAKKRGPFVDSPNILVRFQAEAGKPYTAVVLSQNLPTGKHNFTLSAFTNGNCQLEEAGSRYLNQTVLTDSWRLSTPWSYLTAGGNTHSPDYLENPQFALLVHSPDTLVAIVLRVTSDPMNTLDQTNIHVKQILQVSPVQTDKSLKRLRSHRITRFRPRDVVESSGDYRRGSAIIEAKLKPGIYTLICSTFERNQVAKFSLELFSTGPRPVEFIRIPSDDVGRTHTQTPPASFAHGIAKLAARVKFSTSTMATFVARNATADGHSPSLFKFALETSRGKSTDIVVTSATEDAEFLSVASSLRIEDIYLDRKVVQTEGTDLWITLERPSQAASEDNQSHPVLNVNIYADEKFDVGQWTPIEVD